MTLNEYIKENAGRAGSDSFLREFSSTELFFCIEAPRADLADGPLEASEGAEVRLQIAQLDSGRMALFYASRKDGRLSERFAGIPLIGAAEMICDRSDLDGILIQSDSDAWFVARKEALRNLLDQE